MVTPDKGVFWCVPELKSSKERNTNQGRKMKTRIGQKDIAIILADAIAYSQILESLNDSRNLDDRASDIMRVISRKLRIEVSAVKFQDRYNEKMRSHNMNVLMKRIKESKNVL